MAQKNIVEKYIELVGHFIILISGLPGCGKKELGETLEKELKFKLLNTCDYYKKNYNEKITLKNMETSETDTENNEIELINWYTDDAIDWQLLNDDINKYKTTGVIIIGMSLPKDKIDSDYHLHLNISKNTSMEKIQKYVTKHQDKYPEEFNIISTPMGKLKMNKLIYPYYLETTKLAKINKYITVKDMNDDELCDIAFGFLMQFIQSYLDKSSNPNLPQGSIKLPDKKSQNMDIKLELLDEPKYTYDDELDLINKIENDSDDDDISTASNDDTSD
jgi:adenylate kinase family enzyme